jgi:pantothenate kinase
MAGYDFDYAIESLRQAVDFAEVERDFVPLRKLVNEVERSGQELEAIENSFTSTSGSEILLSILKEVSTGLMLPDEAVKQIESWLQNGQAPASKTEVIPGYQLA